MMFRKNKTEDTGVDPDPVERLAADAAAADAVAEIDTTRLADHRTNPRVLDNVIQARDRLHRKEIALAEGRRSREIDAENRWAEADADAQDSLISQRRQERDDAVTALKNIRRSRREYDPAHAAATAATARAGYTAGFLAFAAAASALSATGLVRLGLATDLGMATAVTVGVLGEAVLTLLVTVIITAQAALARRVGLSRDADGTRICPEPSRWAEILPWVGVGGLLAASVAANAYGALFQSTGLVGALGVVGALAAALCSFLGWGYSVQASAVIAALLDDAGIRDGEDELAETAAGAYIPRANPHAPAVEPDGAREVAAAEVPAMSAEDAEIAAAETLMHMSARDKAIAAHLIAGDPEMLAEVLEARAAALLAENPVPDDAADLAEGGGALGGGHGVDGAENTPRVDTESPAESPENTPPVEAGGGHEGTSHNAAEARPAVDTGSASLDERNRARTAAARDRIAEAVDALRADGADVTPSAVRKRTGMDLRTINRHRDLLDEEKS